MDKVKIYNMKKLAFLAMFFIAGYTGFSQSVSLPEATINPAPLSTIENNGTGVAGFSFAESSGINVPASFLGGPNVTISVNFQYIELTDGDVTAITGTLLNYFTPSYDAGSNILTFLQNTEIPGDEFATVQMPITVIQNSSQQEAFNGFNANIAAIDGNTNAAGNAATFTYTSDDQVNVTKSQVSVSGSGMVGDIITYLITIENTGNTTLTDVLVTDDNAVIDPSFVNPIASMFPRNDANMTPGEIVTVEATHTITQADIDAGYVENSAFAVGSSSTAFEGVSDISDTDTDLDGVEILDNENVETPDGEGLNNNNSTDDPTVTPLGRVDELTVTKTQDSVSGTGALGDVITYTVTVENTGTTTLTDVEVTDDNGVIDPAFVNPVAEMLPGAIVTVEVTHVITQDDVDAGFVENSAVATGENPAGTPVTDDSDTDTDTEGNPVLDNETTETPDGDGTTNMDPTDDPTVTAITQLDELTVTKSQVSVSGTGVLDDVITYTVTVENTGTTTLTDVEVTDDNGVIDPAFVNPIATMEPGDIVTVEVTHIITQDDVDAGFVENSAVATGENPAGTPVTDDSDTDTDTEGNPILDNETTETPDGDGTTNMDPTDDPTVTTITQLDELTVTKSQVSVSGTGVLDDVITYTVTVENTGTTTLTDVEVTDDNGVVDPAFVNPIATMEPGDIVTVEVTHIITQDDVDAGFVENSAVATGENPEGTPVTDDSDTDTDTDGNPVLDNETTETPNGDETTNMDPTDDPTVTPITQLDELTVTKTQVSVSGTGTLDDVITYTVTVENTGTTTLTDVEVTDDNGVIDPAFVNPIAEMLPGAVVTVEVTHIITQDDVDAGFVENSAVATGENPEGTPVTDDSDTDTDTDGNPVLDNETTETPNGDETTNMDPTDDPTVTTIGQVDELTVTKTQVSVSGTGTLNDVITYTVTVENTGNTTLTNVEVTDDNGVIDPAFVNPIAELLPGAVVTVEVTHIITQDDIDTGFVENSAVATGENPEGTPVTDDSDTDTDTEGNPVLDNETTETPDADGSMNSDPTDDPTVTTIDKIDELTVTKSQVSVSGTGMLDDVITYTVTVENTGNTTLTNVEVTDDNGVIDPAFVNPIAEMLPGAIVTVEVTHIITQEDIDSGFVENSAVATGENPEGTPVTDDSDTDTDTAGDPVVDNENTETPDGDGSTNMDPTDDPTVTDLSQLGDLTVTKSQVSISGTGMVDDVITYLVSVENTGNTTLTNVEVTDDNGILDPAFVNPIATMAPGDIVTIVVTHIITQDDIDAGFVENSAVATGENPDGTPETDISDTNTDTAGSPVADNENTETPNGDESTNGNPTDDPTVTTLDQIDELTVTKSQVSVSGTGTIDDVITYLVTVENTGNTTLTNVEVTDDNGVIDAAFVNPIVEMLPGAIVTVEVTHVITQEDIDAGFVENTAVATGETPEGTPVTDDSDTDTDTDGGPIPNNEETETPDGDEMTNMDPTDDPTVTDIDQLGELTVTKSQLGVSGTGTLGDTITYLVTVENTGNITLSDVLVTDDNGVIDAAFVNPIATMAPGDIVTVEVTHVITQADIDAGFVENTAVATGETPDGTPVTDDSDTDTDTDGSPIDDNETVETPNGDDSTNMDPTDDPTVTDIDQLGELTVTKSQVSVSGTGMLDDVITYLVTVENTGNTTLSDVLVTDDNGIIDPGFVNPIAVMIPGDVEIVTVTHVITQEDIDAGYVENTAVATGETSDDGPAVTDDSDTDTDTNGSPIVDNEETETPDGDEMTNMDPTDDPTVTDIDQLGELTVTKSQLIVSGTGTLGDTITYLVTVENTGNTTLSDVLVTDDNGVIDPTFVNPIATMAPGDIVTVEVEHVITQEDIDAGFVENTAVATGETPDGTPVTDDSDTDTDTDGSPIDDNETVETPDGDEMTNMDPTDDPTVTDIDQLGELTVTKSQLIVSGTGTLGDTITYLVTVENTGNTTLTDVLVTDDNGVIDPTFVNPIATMAPGDIVTVEVEHVITQADIDVGFVENTAVATGETPDGATVTDDSDTDTDTDGSPIDDNEETETPNGDTTTNDDPTDDPTVTDIDQLGELTVTKSQVSISGTGMLGDVITYLVTVENTGNTTLSDVLVTDDNGVIDPTFVNPIATMAPGDVVTVEVTHIITQDDIDAGYVENSAVATGETPNGTPVTDDSDTDTDQAGDVIVDNEDTETPDGDGSTNTDPTDDPTVTPIAQNPSIALIKTGVFNDLDGDGCADLGETITYTFTVVNNGNQAITNIDIDDSLVNVMGGPITLLPGETDDVTFTAVYVINQADINLGFVENTATVTGLDPDLDVVSDISDFDNVTDDRPTITDLCNEELIALIKTASIVDTNDNGCADLGETILYDFVVTNLGNTVLTNVIVTDPMVTVDGAAITLGAGESDTETFSAIYTITQEDVDNGFVMNQALVTGEAPNGNIVTDDSDNNSNFEDDPTETILCQDTMISLQKTGAHNDENGDGIGQVGETIIYVFTVENTGNVTVYNITLDDPLPGIVVVGGPIDVLEPGEIDNTTFSATYTLTQDDIDASEVVNQAIATGETAGGTIVEDESDDPSDPTNQDNNGDGDPDDPTVTIIPNVLGGLTIFNGITPDGDGKNEYFQITGISEFPNNNIQIFNRWGVLVFEADEYGEFEFGNVFNGYSNGRSTINSDELLPTGTYFYILKFNGPELPEDDNGKPKDVFTGYLYINR